MVKAGAKTADVVITCTDAELTSLDISLDARMMNPNAKVVMRLLVVQPGSPLVGWRVQKIEVEFSVCAICH